MRYVMLLITLAACSSETTRHERPSQPTQTTSAASGTGGMGGEAGDAGPGCDPWTDVECCAKSDACPEGKLGDCLVDLHLCEGHCAGTPLPSEAPCGDGGTCKGAVGVCYGG